MPKNGKKVSENPKAAAARDRKAETQAVKEHQQKAKAEDQYWADAGAGAKSKAQAKKDDQVLHSLLCKLRLASTGRLGSTFSQYETASSSLHTCFHLCLGL